MNNGADQGFLREAIALARSGMLRGKGGPFGCVIVKDGRVIGQGNNKVLATNDPTAHAEMVAIRDACNAIGDHQLLGCTIYCSCEPCPMCLGAIYWARPRKVYYANSKDDAAKAGFDDQFIYDEIDKEAPHRSIPMEQMLREEAQEAFEKWVAKEDKQVY